MTVQDLFRAGRLQEAIKTLGAELRDNPTDGKRRAFLFELLCFAGEYSRAEKHLNLLADANADASVGALLYRAAMSAERKRQLFFDSKQYESPDGYAEPEPRPGKLNGEPFQTIEDADPRIGSRLELFVAGEYQWLPFRHLRSLRMSAPRLLRDLIWAPATVMAASSLKGQDFGEVVIPVLYPNSSRHPNDSVRLGRETDWVAQDDGQEAPFGQKLLVIDGGERVLPFLEIRELEFDEEEPAVEDAESPEPEES